MAEIEGALDQPARPWALYAEDGGVLRGDEVWGEAEASLETFSLDAALLLSFVAETHGGGGGEDEPHEDEDEDEDAMSRGSQSAEEEIHGLDDLGLM